MTRIICAALIAGSLILAAPSPVKAENWVFVSSGSDVSRFVDPSTFRRSGSYVQFWSRTLYKPSPTKLIEDRSYVMVNCELRQYRTLQSTYYRSDGKSEMDANPTAWLYVVPGSISAAELDYVCANS